MSNEIKNLAPENNFALNAHYRGKDLGTISSLNEYITFRQAHGIDTKQYKDIYIGDYFKIQDGTYNVQWTVAHFDYYLDRGSNFVNPAGILLIAKTYCGSTKMANSDTTTGGYQASIAHVTACPAIANALSTVLGSYLIQTNSLLTNNTSNTNPSMAGANWVGGATDWSWANYQCILPSEIQITGMSATGGSYHEAGSDNTKLALFNFIAPSTYSRQVYYTRTICRNNAYAIIDGACGSSSSVANVSIRMRPLIYIG